MSGIAEYCLHIIKTDGTLWATGRGSYGRLGLGDTENRNILSQVGSASDWISVSCGEKFAMAIKADGSLWSWGHNIYGQLGHGDTVQRNSPTQVGSGTDWAKISCGVGHAVAIKTDGTIWACGSNYYGELGQGSGDRASHSTFVQVGVGDTWSFVSAGAFINHALKTDGTLWSWGHNLSGSLGLGDTALRHDPTQVGSGTTWTFVCAGKDSAMAVKDDGTLWATGANTNSRFTRGYPSSSLTFVQVGSGTSWKSAAVSGANYGTSIALKTDGTLWACGVNYAYRMGVGKVLTYTSEAFEQIGSSSSWDQFAMGSQDAYALDSSGNLYGWGTNAGPGELGLGDAVYRNSPTQITTATAQLFDTIFDPPTFSGLAVLVTAPASSLQTTFVRPFEAAVEVEISIPAVQMAITEIWKTSAPVPSAYITFASDMLLSGEVTAGIPSASFSLSVGDTTHDFEVVAEAHLPAVAFTIGLGNAFSVSARAAMPSVHVGISGPFLVSVEAPVPTVSFSFYREIDWAVRVETTAPSAAITLSQQLLNTFDTWAVNAAHGGHSIYTNYDFTSYFTLGGTQYGVLDGNIYELTGAKDIEADIVSEAIFGVSNLGTDKEKRIDSVYPVVVSSQTTEISVSVAVDSGSKLEYSAPVAANATKPVRCKISRGLSGRYWQIGIKNTDGDPLEVTKMVGVVVPLSRRT